MYTAVPPLSPGPGNMVMDRDKSWPGRGHRADGLINLGRLTWGQKHGGIYPHGS